MRTKMKLAMFALAMLLAVPPVLAQGSQPSGPPTEMAQLESFEGNWVCHGSTPEGPLGPAHKSTTSVKIHSELDGMWLSGHVDEAASKENPHSYKGTMHMNYDTTSKNFVTIWVDNLGSWAKQTSTGWEADKMVWLGDGTMAGKAVVARDTFTKKTGEFEHLGELQIDGNWVVVQNEVCKLQAAKK